MPLLLTDEALAGSLQFLPLGVRKLWSLAGSRLIVAGGLAFSAAAVRDVVGIRIMLILALTSCVRIVLTRRTSIIGAGVRGDIWLRPPTLLLLALLMVTSSVDDFLKGLWLLAVLDHLVDNASSEA